MTRDFSVDKLGPSCHIGRDMDLGRFQCKEEIVWFLRTQAVSYHEKRLAVVKCWIFDGELVGYMTTSMGLTEHNEPKWRTLLGLAGIKRTMDGTGKDMHRFPAMLIGQLGVDTRYQGRGVGGLMVKHAIVSAMGAADDFGCRIVHVDSDRTPSALKLYTSAGFTLPEGQDESRGKAWMYFDLKARPM
jgi:ribosomal protein S18 acetylase RimI-like enzyme